MHEYRTNRCTHATELFLGVEFEGLEALMDRSGAEYCVPIIPPCPTTCGWCGEPIVSVHFPNHGWINTTVFTDEDGVLRANLLAEHRCAPMERFAHRLDARDPWEGDVE